MDKKNLLIAAPKEGSGYKVEMYSPAFYAASTIGGILSCGLTHTAVTPLDLVKCNMQVYIYFSRGYILIFSNFLSITN